MTINTSIFGDTNRPVPDVQFQLFINGITPVIESTFQSSATLFAIPEAFGIERTITIGRTIQIRLNANDSLSIHTVAATEFSLYQRPSLTVIKIAE